MGLLDGGLQAVFAGAFGPLFLDGVLHVATTTPDGQGGYTTSPADHPVKGMVDGYSEGYRTRFEIPDTDVRLIVLQHGVGAVPSTDGEITLRGVRWRIVGPIEQDPAMAAWTMRARPA